MIAKESKFIKEKRRSSKTEGKNIELAGMLRYLNLNITVNQPNDHITYQESGAASHVFHSKSSSVPSAIVTCEP